MDTNLMAVMCDSRGFGYINRLRSNVTLISEKGEKRTAAAWVGSEGRARTLRSAGLTGKKFPVPTVVCLRDKAMKEAWCLAASDPKAAASDLKKYYAKR